MKEILINCFIFAIGLLCIGGGIIAFIPAKSTGKIMMIFLIFIGFILLIIH